MDHHLPLAARSLALFRQNGLRLCASSSPIFTDPRPKGSDESLSPISLPSRVTPCSGRGFHDGDRRKRAPPRPSRPRASMTVIQWRIFDSQQLDSLMSLGARRLMPVRPLGSVRSNPSQPDPAMAEGRLFSAEAGRVHAWRKRRLFLAPDLFASRAKITAPPPSSALLRPTLPPSAGSRGCNPGSGLGFFEPHRGERTG
jgi:hypothetical protein